MISNFKFVKYKDAFDLKKFLKKKLPLKKNVFRYNFHKNNLDEDQFMLIWQRKNYYYPPKKFFDTSKTYVLLKGKIDVLILNSKGKLIKAYNLNRSNPVCRIKKNVYHLDISRSKISIHIEQTNHSFVNRKIKFLNKNYFTNFQKYLK